MIFGQVNVCKIFSFASTLLVQFPATSQTLKLVLESNVYKFMFPSLELFDKLISPLTISSLAITLLLKPEPNFSFKIS